MQVLNQPISRGDCRSIRLDLIYLRYCTKDAVMLLARRVGLNSLVLAGEGQILAQVKQCHQSGQQCLAGSVGRILKINS
jgi:glutamyl-tRNA reductase